jgi:hypothetical protein
MNKNQRKNRPKKKEIPPEVWGNQIENLKRMYEYGGKRQEEKKSGNSA